VGGVKEYKVNISKFGPVMNGNSRLSESLSSAWHALQGTYESHASLLARG
jgi:hypothetical protein